MGAKEPPREENHVPRDEEIRADVIAKAKELDRISEELLALINSRK